MADRELWTIDQVAALLGVKPSSARGALSRMGVRASSFRPHPESHRAQALYDPDEVKAAHAERPGKGARTDLASGSENVMSADFTSIANLINQRGTALDRSQLVSMLEEAAHRDPEVTANAAHAVTYHQVDRGAFLRATAERTANRILEQLQFRAEPYSFHLVAVALRSAAGAEADAQASNTTR